MQERIKMFTFVSGHGETLVDCSHEEHINQWLAGAQGEIIDVTQSESERVRGGHHITVCIWYLPRGTKSTDEQHES